MHLSQFQLVDATHLNRLRTESLSDLLFLGASQGGDTSLLPRFPPRSGRLFRRACAIEPLHVKMDVIAQAVSKTSLCMTIVQRSHDMWCGPSVAVYTSTLEAYGITESWVFIRIYQSTKRTVPAVDVDRHMSAAAFSFAPLKASDFMARLIVGSSMASCSWASCIIRRGIS